MQLREQHREDDTGDTAARAQVDGTPRPGAGRLRQVGQAAADHRGEALGVLQVGNEGAGPEEPELTAPRQDVEDGVTVGRRHGIEVTEQLAHRGQFAGGGA